MSVLSDVKDLYGTIETTWADRRAQLLTHAVAAAIIFWICGVTLPELGLPDLDPKQILEDNWFKLAKDSGLIYVGLLIPILVVAVYLTVLRHLGQFWLSLTVILVSGRFKSPFSDLSERDLEPLALLVKKEEFELTDITEKLGMLAMQYQSKKSEMWASYQKSLSGITSNSIQYFGNFSIFLLAWIAVFIIFSDSQWAAENRMRACPVSALLFVVMVLSWLRVSKAVQIVPRATLLTMSAIVRTDPDLPPLAEIPEEQRKRVRERLKMLLAREQSEEREAPTLRKLLVARFGLKKRGRKDAPRRRIEGRPFPALFKQGEALAERLDPADGPQDVKNQDIIAYIYYSVHRRLSQMFHVVISMLRYSIFGAP